ncbi:MAG: hypothetical protein LBU60_00235 [Clostridiales bacterium]|jgi:hypothetical protein|nr:hypothetical protein [Clostridiales bacterium]
MTIGLFILGLLSILVFFGIIKKLLIKIGIPEWLAYLTILTMTLGVVVSPLQVFGMSMSVSGFFVPLLLVAVLCFSMGFCKPLLQAFTLAFIIAGMAVLVRIVIPKDLIDGFVYLLVLGCFSGAVSALMSKTHKAALIGSIGGILLFELGLGIYDRIFNFDVIYLGSLNSLDIIMIAITSCVMLMEIVLSIKSSSQLKSTENSVSLKLASQGTESATDAVIKTYSQDVDSKDVKEKAMQNIDENKEQNQQKDLQKQYVDYFSESET